MLTFSTSERHHTGTTRLRRVWAYAVCLAAIVGTLAVVLTDEPRTLIVVMGLVLALGTLGSLMAAASARRNGTAG
jgi:hypothetical protein